MCWLHSNAASSPPKIQRLKIMASHTSTPEPAGGKHQNGFIPCSLWVNNGHRDELKECPLYPRKRTSIGPSAMSALCQKRTLPFGIVPASILSCGPHGRGADLQERSGGWVRSCLRAHR